MRRLKLSGTSSPIWERCGHTPFYRRFSGPFPGALFVDPFSWTVIAISGMETKGPEEGTFTVGYRRAPHYDWEAVKAGIVAMASSREEQLRIMRAVHEWATNLIKERPTAHFRDLVKRFEAQPEDVREDVLSGVQALVEFNLPDIFIKGTEMEEHMLLVIPADAIRSGKVEPKAQYPGIDRIIIADTPEEGVDQALEHFGIHEC